MEAVTQIAEEFSVYERVLVGSILRETQGDITTLRLVRRFREELSFSEEEHAALNFHQEGEQVVWDLSKAPAFPKTVVVGPKVRELIMLGLLKLSTLGQLSDPMINICDRFLPEEEEGAA